MMIDLDSNFTTCMMLARFSFSLAFWFKLETFILFKYYITTSWWL